MAIPEYFEKQSAEAYTIAIEFSGKLPSGATLSSGTVTAQNTTTGLTDNTVLGSTTATISGTQAKVKVQAGTNQVTYKITFTLTLSDASILEEDIRMKVVDI